VDDDAELRIQKLLVEVEDVVVRAERRLLSAAEHLLPVYAHHPSTIFRGSPARSVHTGAVRETAAAAANIDYRRPPASRSI